MEMSKGANAKGKRAEGEEAKEVLSVSDGDDIAKPFEILASCQGFDRLCVQIPTLPEHIMGCGLSSKVSQINGLKKAITMHFRMQRVQFS